MYKNLSLLILIMLFSLTVFAGELLVRVEGVLEFEGDIHIGVFDSEESWKNRRVKVGAYVDPSDEVYYNFKNLPEGEYMVSIFHDVNSNDKLDRYFYGKPKEPYGFSKNKFGAFGKPPKFKQASIQVKGKTETTIVLR